MAVPCMPCSHHWSKTHPSLTVCFCAKHRSCSFKLRIALPLHPSCALGEACVCAVTQTKQSFDYRDNHDLDDDDRDCCHDYHYDNHNDRDMALAILSRILENCP